MTLENKRKITRETQGVTMITSVDGYGLNRTVAFQIIKSIENGTVPNGFAEYLKTILQDPASQEYREAILSKTKSALLQLTPQERINFSDEISQIEFVLKNSDQFQPTQTEKVKTQPKKRNIFGKLFKIFEGF